MHLLRPKNHHIMAVFPKTIVRNMRLPSSSLPVKARDIASPHKNVPTLAFQKLLIESADGHDHFFHLGVGKLWVAWEA